MKIKIKYLQNFPEGCNIRYASSGSSGFDLIACENFCLMPQARTAVSTGIQLEIPFGYEGQIRSRSGLAINDGIAVLNSPGTIDSDYRGEIKVILINNSDKPFNISIGDRIAQMVISKIEYAEFEEAKCLSETERNDKGFGSSGVSDD